MLRVARLSRFTVVELIAVIAIVSVLLAALLPSLNRARTRAQFARWTAFKQNQLGDAHLVAYYDFQRGPAAAAPSLLNRAVAPEAFGNAYIPERYDGSIVRAVWTTGRWPRSKTALYFNGANAYVDCGSEDLFDIREAITVMVWVCHFGYGWHYIVNMGGGWSANGYSMFWLNNSIRIELQDTARGEKAISDCPAPTNEEWHHLAFTWDLRTKKICAYIDGAKVRNSPDTFNGPIGAPTQNFNIGRNATYAYPFSGMIDEVAIFNRALGPGEIAAAYAVGKP